MRITLKEVERYMTICSYNSEGTLQNCPNTYPWLETDQVNPCGGNMPCKDAVESAPKNQFVKLCK